MTERIYAVDNGYIDYDPSIPGFISAVVEYMPSPEFRLFMMAGLDLLTEKIDLLGNVAWIADIRKTEIYDQEDIEWALGWNKKAYEAGLRYMAMIMPESMFATLNVQEYMEERKRKSDTLVVKQFGDLDSAKEWYSYVLKP